MLVMLTYCAGVLAIYTEDQELWLVYEASIFSYLFTISLQDSLIEILLHVNLNLTLGQLVH